MTLFIPINQKRAIPLFSIGAAFIALILAGLVFFIQPQTNAAQYDPEPGSVLPIPTYNGVTKMVAGPDDSVWFFDNQQNTVGKIDSVGTITDYVIPTDYSALSDILYGPDGNIWLLRSDGMSIVKIDTSDGTVLINEQGDLERGYSFAPSPQGLYAYTSTGVLHLLSTSDGSVTSTTNPFTGTLNTEAVVYGGGKFWFLNAINSEIGSYDPATNLAQVYETSIQNAGDSEFSTLFGSDGNIWYFDASDKLVKFDIVSHVSTQYPLIPTTESSTLVNGPDGRLWVSGSTDSNILKVDPADGTYTTVALDLSGAPHGQILNTLLFGPQHSLWIAYALPALQIAKAPVEAGPLSSAVTDLQLFRSAGTVQLNWALPIIRDEGNEEEDPPEEAYTVDYRVVGEPTWENLFTAENTRFAEISELSNSDAYEFRVTPTGVDGDGTASIIRSEARTTPEALANLVLLSTGNGTLSITWDDPRVAVPYLTSAGWPVQSFQIEYKRSIDSVWQTTTAYGNSHIIPSLVNGTAYDVRVSAVNLLGAGGVSNTITGAPAGAPDAPTGLNTTPGFLQVGLNWTAPVNNGGSALTDYRIQYKLTSSGTWLTFTDGVSLTTSTTVTGLVNGSSYDFRVAALNSTGVGTYSTQQSATPRTVPGVPTGLDATPGNTEVALDWTAPASNGGSAITDYLVEYKLGTDGSWNTFADGTSTATTATVTGLTNGLLYNFRVNAVNAAGNGTSTGTVNSTPRTVPGAPTDLITTAGTSQVALSWTAPVNNGGSAITDYLVEYKLSTDSSWSTFTDGVTTSTTTTVTSLSNASLYNFRVTAINIAGNSASSDVTSATPSTVPNAPASISAMPGDTQVALSWTAPVSDGGKSITSYEVEYKLHSAGSWTSVAHAVPLALSDTITGLSNGETYDFRVRAVNDNGNGPFVSLLSISLDADEEPEQPQDPGTPSSPGTPSTGTPSQKPNSSGASSGSETVETPVNTEDITKLIIDLAPSTVITNLRPTFTGTYLPNTTIIIEIHSNPIIAKLTTDANGKWTYTPTIDLAPGSHTIYAYTVNDLGEKDALQDTIAFSVEATSTETPQTTTQSPSNIWMWVGVVAGIILAIIILIIVIAKRRQQPTSFL